MPKFDRSDNEIWRDRYVSEYTFREKVSHEVMDETIFLTFVELDRFDKELEELRVQVFERLFEACEIARFTPEEKLEYEHDMMTERDYTNILNTYRAEALAEGEAKGFSNGEAKGRAEGLTEGRAEGRAEGKIEGRDEGRKEEQLRIAKAMIEKGIDTMTIASVTGLTPKDIEKL